MPEMDPIVREFLEESLENLERVDRDLVTLEKSPGDATLVDRIFRAVHTIKGTCGFLGFSRLEALSHVGEELLARVRAVDVGSAPWVIPLLLELVDSTRRILETIEREGSDEGVSIEELAGRLAEAARRLSPSPVEEAAEDVPGGDAGLWEDTENLDRETAARTAVRLEAETRRGRRRPGSRIPSCGWTFVCWTG